MIVNNDPMAVPEVALLDRIMRLEEELKKFKELQKNQMMRKLVDFRCVCDKAELKECRVEDDERERCSCGKEMVRLVGAPSLGGFDKLGRSK